MYKDVGIIGAGVSGMSLARTLGMMGFSCAVFEKNNHTGGNITELPAVFPLKLSGASISTKLTMDLAALPVTIFLQETPDKISYADDCFEINTHQHTKIRTRALVIATGFTYFDARRKEEYGYGVYPEVITSREADRRLLAGNFFDNAPLQRSAFVHCVGSRDEKAGVHHCSKLCCITAIRQAIAVRVQFPGAEVFCFYMDIRTFNPGYEELYREAQEKWGVKFIRGRISEVAPAKDGGVIIKSEDTLMGRPLRMILSRLVLMNGVVPPTFGPELSGHLALPRQSSGFFSPRLQLADPSPAPGIFMAGACTGPKTIDETIDNACSVAFEVARYLKMPASPVQTTSLCQEKSLVIN